MDLAGLKAIAIPSWVKLLVGCILAIALTADLFTIYIAVIARGGAGFKDLARKPSNRARDQSAPGSNFKHDDDKGGVQWS